MNILRVDEHITPTCKCTGIILDNKNFGSYLLNSHKPAII